MITKCACLHCGNPIEFEAEHSGMRAPCPHCGNETVLELPIKKSVEVQVKLPEPPQIEGPKKVEDSLDDIADLFFALGVVAALIAAAFSIFAFGSGAGNEAAGLSFAVGAVAAFLQGLIFKTLFRAIAEIIRLLRVIASKTHASE